MNLNIAIPKGRLGEEIVEVINRGGLGPVDLSGRQLVFRTGEGRSYHLIKNTDVVTYVENRVFDLGFTGSDMLEESGAKVYALERLPLGSCTMAIAAMKGRALPDRSLRVATKYPRIARRYFREKSQEIDIVKLNGSVELGACVGLSHCIVDIVETGKTLRANGLEVLETLFPVSCYIIANRHSYRFKKETIDQLIEQFLEAL